ncbi:hypothetical protein TNCV_4154971 [Trichonephila clavipes]|nr:hypothetical protein TNCV_4154971 [Trichonephila clavipes]
MRLPHIAKVDLVERRVVYPGPVIVQAWTTRFRLAIDRENKQVKEAIQSVGVVRFLCPRPPFIAPMAVHTSVASSQDKRSNGHLTNIPPCCKRRRMNGLQQAEVVVDFSPAHPRPMEIPYVISQPNY